VLLKKVLVGKVMVNVFKSVTNYLILKNNQIVNKQLDSGIKVSLEKNNILIEVNNASNVILQVNLNEIKESTNINYLIHSNSHLKIIELHNFNHSVDFNRHIDIQEGCNITFLSFNEGNRLVSIKANDYFKIGKDVTLSSAYGELSDCSIKGTYFYDLIAEGSHTNVKIAALSTQKATKELYVSLQHKARNTYGEMENYGVCQNQGYLKFEGLGKIDFDQSLASSHQTSKIMVLDENCRAEVNPLLMIDHHDVQASHAAGVGRMDVEQLYYLQSRGLTADEAKHLITIGYLLPIVKEMDNQEVTDYFADILYQKVGK